MKHIFSSFSHLKQVLQLKSFHVKYRLFAMCLLALLITLLVTNHFSFIKTHKIITIIYSVKRHKTLQTIIRPSIYTQPNLISLRITSHHISSRITRTILISCMKTTVECVCTKKKSSCVLLDELRYIETEFRFNRR